MAYDNANAYETIELFGLTEKGAELPTVVSHMWWKLPGGVLRADDGWLFQAARSMVSGARG